MGKGWFLRIFIFALLWIVGGWFFQDYGGAIGTQGSMLFIGESIVGSNLQSDADNIVMMIITFIITAAVYFIVALILTFILQKIFRRGE